MNQVTREHEVMIRCTIFNLLCVKYQTALLPGVCLEGFLDCHKEHVRFTAPTWTRASFRTRLPFMLIPLLLPLVICQPLCIVNQLCLGRLSFSHESFPSACFYFLACETTVWVEPEFFNRLESAM